MKEKIPHLPLAVSKDEAIETIREELEGNEWLDIEIPVPTLLLTPYYLFHYDFYTEEETESKTKNVEESTEGVSALNAAANTLEPEIGELAELEKIIDTFVPPKGITWKARTPRFEKDEAKGIAQIRIAAQEKVPRGNVHITGVILLYVPNWIFSVELDGESLTLRLNAVSGELEGAGEVIPYHGKTRTQVFRETISDLRDPESWGQYVGELFHDFWHTIHPGKDNPANYWMIIFLLILVALILLAIGFIPLPPPQ